MPHGNSVELKHFSLGGNQADPVAAKNSKAEYAEFLRRQMEENQEKKKKGGSGSTKQQQIDLLQQKFEQVAVEPFAK